MYVCVHECMYVMYVCIQYSIYILSSTDTGGVHAYTEVHANNMKHLPIPILGCNVAC